MNATWSGAQLLDSATWSRPSDLPQNLLGQKAKRASRSWRPLRMLMGMTQSDEALHDRLTPSTLRVMFHVTWMAPPPVSYLDFMVIQHRGHAIHVTDPCTADWYYLLLLLYNTIHIQTTSSKRQLGIWNRPDTLHDPTRLRGCSPYRRRGWSPYRFLLSMPKEWRLQSDRNGHERKAK